MTDDVNRAWAEIDLEAIAHNVGEIRRITDKRAEIMCSVKANAYGHGMEEVAKTLLDNGVSRLCVATLDEAVQVRKIGIHLPVLILGYTETAQAEKVISYNITQTVFSLELARALSGAASRLGKHAKVHVKIDTGMTRVGFAPGYDTVKKIIEISRLPGLAVEGIFTHLATADDEDRYYTDRQFERFLTICNELDKLGFDIPIKHLCNSAGIIRYPEMHMDMVRPGIALYGLSPLNGGDCDKIFLKPAMSLKARVVSVMEVEQGTDIGYGGTFRMRKSGRIATIPVGYGDGYTRLLSNNGLVLVKGEMAPVVGRVCMDQCMVDVTDLENRVCVGDEAVLFGSQGEFHIGAEEVAARAGTISYELVCGITARIPRVYLRNKKIISIRNYLL